MKTSCMNVDISSTQFLCDVSTQKMFYLDKHVNAHITLIRMGRSKEYK